MKYEWAEQGWTVSPQLKGNIDALAVQRPEWRLAAILNEQNVACVRRNPMRRMRRKGIFVMPVETARRIDAARHGFLLERQPPFTTSPAQPRCPPRALKEKVAELLKFFEDGVCEAARKQLASATSRADRDEDVLQRIERTSRQGL